MGEFVQQAQHVARHSGPSGTPHLLCTSKILLSTTTLLAIHKYINHTLNSTWTSLYNVDYTLSVLAISANHRVPRSRHSFQSLESWVTFTIAFEYLLNPMQVHISNALEHCDTFTIAAFVQLHRTTITQGSSACLPFTWPVLLWHFQNCGTFSISLDILEENLKRTLK